MPASPSMASSDLTSCRCSSGSAIGATAWSPNCGSWPRCGGRPGRSSNLRVVIGERGRAGRTHHRLGTGPAPLRRRRHRLAPPGRLRAGPAGQRRRRAGVRGTAQPGRRRGLPVHVLPRLQHDIAGRAAVGGEVRRRVPSALGVPGLGVVGWPSRCCGRPGCRRWCARRARPEPGRAGAGRGRRWSSTPSSSGSPPTGRELWRRGRRGWCDADTSGSPGSSERMARTLRHPARPSQRPARPGVV